MLPGAIDELGSECEEAQGDATAATDVKRAQPKKDVLESMPANGKSLSPSALFAHVWEYGTKWEVTHQFNVGLELDCGSACNGGGPSRVHLPALSLHAVQHLRIALQSPGALALDLQVSSKDGLTEVHAALLSKLSRELPAEQVSEVRSKLAERLHVMKSMERLRTVAELLPGVSEGSEVFVRAEDGREAVDISVCIVADLEGRRSPLVAFARVANVISVESHGQMVSVRYVAVILCPSRLGRLATKLGEAFAVGFMDEEFVKAVNAITAGNPEALSEAYDHHLSNLTIVPTVNMEEEGDDASPVRNLSDAVLSGIERMISESRGLDGEVTRLRSSSSLDPSPGAASPVGQPHFYVEVDELASGVDQWKLTHRLHHGLEQDGVSQDTGVHLPNVSVTALAELWTLIQRCEFDLDLSAESPVAAINSVVNLLRKSDCSPAAVDHVLRSLMDRVVDASVVTPTDAPDKEGEDLFCPVQEDEACHVLALTSKHLPANQPIMAAFVRLKSPLSFRLPSTAAMARFFWVFVGPEKSYSQLTTLVASVAAVASDEDLLGCLREARHAERFVAAFDKHLNNLSVIPRVRVGPKPSALPRDASVAATTAPGEHSPSASDEEAVGLLGKLNRARKKTARALQKYSVPLVSGVLTALVWANIDKHSYDEIVEGSLTGEWNLWNHTISLHFIVNDIFMCFFFGLAIKEVTEALLPGGSLNPIRCAVNPLMATLGGVVGPAVAYLVMVGIFWSVGSFEGQQCVQPNAAPSGHRRLSAGGAVHPMHTEPCDVGTLLKGWGVPTATDISLAWMFSVLIFGVGHPAINFLLLLAIVDDALGMIIIAVCYPDPLEPPQPQWLALCVAAMVMAFALRKLKVPFWTVYVFVCGPVAWCGLILAHVHPALALCFVVPFIPAEHALEVQDFNAPDLGKNDWGQGKPQPGAAGLEEVTPKKRKSLMNSFSQMVLEWDKAPLHVLEHDLKLPVDFGMFFFGLCNAGVKLKSTGAVTASVLIALTVGKTLGITFFSLLGAKLGFPVPPGITIVDLVAMAALGGIGLTVALFVANEAFVDPDLKGQAKFAAVLSVCGAGIAYTIRTTGNKLLGITDADDIEDEADNMEGNYIDTMMAAEVMSMMKLQRKYKNRGVTVNIDTLQSVSRKSSKRNSMSMIPAGQGPLTAEAIGKAFERVAAPKDRSPAPPTTSATSVRQLVVAEEIL